MILAAGGRTRLYERNSASDDSVKYSSRFKDKPNFMEWVTRGEPRQFDEGSQEEFITRQYWGYSSQQEGGTVE